MANLEDIDFESLHRFLMDVFMPIDAARWSDMENLLKMRGIIDPGNVIETMGDLGLVEYYLEDMTFFVKVKYV